MFRKLCLTTTLLAISTGLLASAARAQSLAGLTDGVSAIGSKSIDVKPNRLRLVMWVQAQGKDAKAAITSLNAHKQRVSSELETMKADVASIRFSPTTLASGAGDNPQQQQMRRIQMQMRGMSGDNKAPEFPETFTAKCALSAEWPLPVTEGDALALLPATLTEQIEKRDFMGKKNVPELDAKAKEQLAEMQAMMEDQYGYYGSEEGAKGTTIYFVGDLPEEELKGAVKSAFEAADKKVQFLAEAAGLKLAKLKTMAVSPDESELQQVYYGYQRPEEYPSNFTEAGENSVIATSLAGLKKKVQVIVVYSVEQ